MCNKSILDMTEDCDIWVRAMCLHHFQQYFSYIVVVSLLVEETGVPEENHRSAASHC